MESFPPSTPSISTRADGAMKAPPLPAAPTPSSPSPPASTPPPPTPILALFGGTDGLSFFNDVTVYSPSSTGGGVCEKCNGPAYWYKLGGGSKGEACEGGGGGEGDRVGWGVAYTKICRGRCALYERGMEREGWFVFGGMDEEKDMGDALLLQLRRANTITSSSRLRHSQ